MAYASYSVHKNRNDDHVLYNVFVRNDMKDFAKVHGAIATPGAQRHTFCAALRFVL